MIEVSNLTKRFAARVAVDDISFQVRRGEIVGFLGPNGAGKTTTMRMLTGYLPASGGNIRIAGRDVLKESLEVRRRIGYLPEHCPLYPEMRVDEYLRFRAKLKGVLRRDRKKRVEEVKALCGVREVGTRIIGQLSKGYRQRVGMAEALVHDPELLILDEPTIGLDPNQIRQVRGLIRDLASRHTILLSTHILPEVDMTCQRVLIIHNGRIVASDTPENLRRRTQAAERVVAEIRGPVHEIVAALEALPSVQRVTVDEAEADWPVFGVECGPDADPGAEIFDSVVRRGWRLRELRRERSTLEDTFVALTRNAGPGGRG
jgi:ABC-2 type transport system ATP-binding protein